MELYNAKLSCIYEIKDMIIASEMSVVSAVSKVWELRVRRTEIIHQQRIKRKTSPYSLGINEHVLQKLCFLRFKEK